MNIPIKEVDYGIVSCVSNKDKKWIQINRHLKEYPKLYRSAIVFELDYLKPKSKYDTLMFNLKELFDFKDHWEILKFSIKYPKAFYDFLPFYYDKEWNMNFSAIMAWSTLIVALGIFIWLV